MKVHFYGKNSFPLLFLDDSLHPGGSGPSFAMKTSKSEGTIAGNLLGINRSESSVSQQANSTSSGRGRFVNKLRSNLNASFAKVTSHVQSLSSSAQKLAFRQERPDAQHLKSIAFDHLTDDIAQCQSMIVIL